VPADNGWFDAYSDDYDFIYLDEYRGHCTVRILNSLAEGRQMPLPRRGITPIIKKKNLPLIVCSNMSPYEVYSKCGPLSLEALVSRFLIVYLPHPIELKFYDDEVSSDEDTAPLMSDDDE
jgi:hypothetical protein